MQPFARLIKSKTLKKGEFTLGVFADPSKASDAVDQKLQSLKIDMENYLNELQRFLWKWYFHKLFSVPCRLPQGSILYDVYVNDSGCRQKLFQ